MTEHCDGRDRRWVAVWRDLHTRRRRVTFYTLSEARTFLYYALPTLVDFRGPDGPRAT